MRHIESIFPVAIGIVENISFDFGSIVESVEWLEADWYSPGSQSSSNFRVLDSRPNIKSTFENEATVFAREVYRTQVDMRMTTSWLTKTAPGGFSNEHHHSNSVFSGVWYPDDGCDIMFSNPIMEHGTLWSPPDQLNEFSTGSYHLPARRNMLVLFPSWLKHRIVRNSGDVRYSLAFNFFPADEFGDNDSTFTVR